MHQTHFAKAPAENQHDEKAGQTCEKELDHLTRCVEEMTAGIRLQHGFTSLNVGNWAIHELLQMKSMWK
jgi:hypothetical protein